MLIPPDTSSRVLERIEACIACTGCELNFTKSGFFSMVGCVDIGASRIQRLHAVPHVLRLPLPLEVRAGVIHYDMGKGAEVIQHRMDIFDRLY